MAYYVVVGGNNVALNLYAVNSTQYPSQNTSGKDCRSGQTNEYHTSTHYHTSGNLIYCNNWTTVWTGSKTLTIPVRVGRTSTTTLTGLTLPSASGNYRIYIQFTHEGSFESNSGYTYTFSLPRSYAGYKLNGAQIDPTQHWNVDVTEVTKVSDTSMTITLLSSFSSTSSFFGPATVTKIEFEPV